MTPAALSEASFFLLARGEDCQNVLINTVARDVSAISKINEPLSILIRQIINEAPHFRMCAKGLHTPQNGFTRSLGCQWAFGLQEFAKAFKITNSCWREDYLWHSGAALSSSVPHVDSHFSTSSAVACRSVA